MKGDVVQCHGKWWVERKVTDLFGCIKHFHFHSASVDDIHDIINGNGRLSDISS